MKKVGVLSFHPAFTPPSSGGELRLYHLLKKVAQGGFQVTLASPTYGESKEEHVDHLPGFSENRYPKTHLYNKFHHGFARFGKFVECSGLVCSLACRHHLPFRQEAERLARESDIFIHEYAFLTPLVPRRGHARQIFVYDAHNVESLLAGDMFGKSIAGRMATRRIRNLEKQLVRESDVLLVTSEEDMEAFVRVHGADRTKMVLAPNGVDVEALRPPGSIDRRLEARATLGASNTRPVCFFIGSFHPPNVEAVDIIIHQLAAKTPDVDFLIAGKVCRAFDGQDLPANLRMMGLISEEEKLALFHGADVALNPMRSGSGTNLKMLEYFAAGLPILATPVGARGLAVENRRHAVIMQEKKLLLGLEEILSDAALRSTLSEEARSLAEERYSWDSIGETVANVYQLKTGPRLIILNDYPVTPAEQGGQVRVEAVGRTLSDAGVKVSLLTLTRDSQCRRVQPLPGLEELNVRRSPLQHFMDGVVARFAGSGADDVSALVLTRWLTPQFKRVLKRELRHAQGVMFSHPYLQPYAKYLPKGTTVFYDSHNTEYQLKEALYKKSFLARQMIRRVRQAEQRAARRSVATFCVSEQNRDQLAELVPGLVEKSYIAPNGVDCSKVRVLTPEQRKVLRREAGFGREFVAIFLGSGHPPNAEAARLIINRIARDHPRVLFLLVGSVCGWFWNTHLPGNVLVMGVVSTPVKNFLLEVSDFALNPMLTGSGTSLKLFDYMAAGLPVLSTDVGARGLNEEELKSVVLLEPEEFSHGLRDLLKDPEACRQFARQVRHTAEQHFDWSVALRGMADVISSELGIIPPTQDIDHEAAIEKAAVG